jgi:diguanylate cyclase (GGDEF)-like protein/PAS domain S-box-containing protein
VGLGLLGLHKDGREFPLEMSIHTIETDEGVCVAAIVRGVSELRRALEESAWLTAIVNSTGDAIVGLAADGTIASWNPAAERLYGYTATEVLGRREEILTPPRHRGEHADLRARALAGEIVAQSESDGLRQDGGTFPVAITASPIHDGRGRVIGIAQIVRDVTARVRFEHGLKYFADHDPLTGLINRRRFAEELARHVAYRERYPQVGGALLMGDLDNFKYVNDTLGHKAGDELIKAVAHQLRGRLRESDVLGRLGGDEFAVLLPRAELEQASGVAETLREVVAGLEVVIGGHRLRATISIGVAPLDADSTAEDALAAADIAMYEAKRGGRNRVAAAVADEPADSSVKRHLGWAERLRTALAEDRFELYTQPIVELSTGSVTRYELLLRMRENGELISPAAFIYTAERFNLIEEIDRLVIRRAIRLLADQSDASTNYHVNLSGLSIVKPDLLKFLARELASTAVDPARLTFEITETAAIIDMDAAERCAHGLHAIGCSLALDDFGCGFGSFSYLKYVPVEFLKIDGSFVTNLVQSNSDRLLVKAMIDVAHGMQIQAIAEHVASEETRQLLEEYGVDYGQGYHLGQPLPLHPVAADRNERPPSLTPERARSSVTSSGQDGQGSAA